jgi:hypothetical protein
MRSHRWFSTLVLIILLAGCIPAATQPASPTPLATQVPGFVKTDNLPYQCLYVQFERRGMDNNYWTGQVIQDFFSNDYRVGHTVKEEVALQLDIMREMGVNAIALELRSSDPDPNWSPFSPPGCYLPPVLGFRYPQPTDLELENIIAFFDLIDSKGMKIFLRLVNTHMEEDPPLNNEVWLGAILNTIKDHPALELVSFEGNTHLIDGNGDGEPDACGGPAEPPLWLGAASKPGLYVKWAIKYGLSLGIPANKLSAEAIVGDPIVMRESPAGPEAADSHLWNPIEVLKQIYDELSIPDDQRTYAISFYEHRKCLTAGGQPCTDEEAATWAEKTIQQVYQTIGDESRVVAVEMGNMVPVSSDWTTEQAFEDLFLLMQKYGMQGGCYWRWTSFYDYEDLDERNATPVKKRGINFVYTPVKDVLTSYFKQSISLEITAMNPASDTAQSAPVAGPLKNGETLKLEVKTNAGGLKVLAEVSLLDSNQVEPVQLLEIGDGLYGIDLTISADNQTPNGSKRILVTARDDLGNVGTGIVLVDLQNEFDYVAPVISPDDDFAGAVLDESKWSANSGNGGMISQDGRLVLTTSSAQATSSAGVTTVWAFTGDFDVQVDFEIGEGWARPQADHLDGAAFGVSVAGSNYHVTRLRTGSDDSLFVWQQIGNAGQVLRVTPSNATSGSYRLIRNGTALTFQYDFGNGWVELARVEIPLGLTKIYMDNASINASQAFTTYFDNFLINSGETSYNPGY